MNPKKEELKVFIDQLNYMAKKHPETKGHTQTLATHFRIKSRNVQPQKATA